MSSSVSSLVQVCLYRGISIGLRSSAMKCLQSSSRDPSNPEINTAVVIAHQISNIIRILTHVELSGVFMPLSEALDFFSSSFKEVKVEVWDPSDTSWRSCSLPYKYPCRQTIEKLRWVILHEWSGRKAQKIDTNQTSPYWTYMKTLSLVWHNSLRQAKF